MTVAISSDFSGSEPHFCVGVWQSSSSQPGDCREPGWRVEEAARLTARRTAANCTDHAAGTGVHTPDGPSRTRRGRPGQVSQSREGGGGCPAHRAVRPAHACGEEPERSREERSGGPGAQRPAPWLRRRRQWQRRVSECQAIAGNRAAGTQTGRGGAPPLRGRERVPRVDRGAGARERRKEARAAGTLGRGRGVGARPAAAPRRESPGHERPPRLRLCCHPARPRPAGGRSPVVTAQLAAVREEQVGAATHAPPLPARVSGRAWVGSLGAQSAQKGGGGEGEDRGETSGDTPRGTLRG